MKKEQNYEDMLKELENIVHKLESDDVDIDSLTIQLTRAKKLINDCKTRLKKVEDDVKKLSVTED